METEMSDYAYYAAKGLTQSETAKAMGVSRSAVSDYAKKHDIKFVKHKQRGIEYNGYESYGAAARAEGITEPAIWNRVNVPRKNKNAAPKVKQIKWRNFEWKGVPESKSLNTITRYSVFFRDHVSLWGASFINVDGHEEAIELEYQDCAEAKAAAHSHYANQILEALE
jgi:hypothetical protein